MERRYHSLLSADGYKLSGSRCCTRRDHYETGGSPMRIGISGLLLMPAAAVASSAFDGTWKTNLDSMKVSGKPDVYLLADGEYTCSSCDPELKVKADGAEHKVTGHAYYDTAMVKVISPTSDEISLKQGGKEFARLSGTVSAD